MATITSVTGTDLDWYTPATWVGGVVPNDGDSVVIPSGSHVLGQDPEFEHGWIYCDDILIQSGGSLTLTAFFLTMPITVHGSITFNGGGMLNTCMLTLEAGAVAHKGPGYEQMEGVIVVKAGSSLLIEGGQFYAGVLRIAGEVTIDDDYVLDFSWNAIVEAGGVLTFVSAWVFDASVVVETGGELNLSGGNYSQVNLTIDGVANFSENVFGDLGWIIVHSGGELDVESTAATCRVLSTYSGAVITHLENLLYFVRHEIDEVKSHDLPGESDVRSGVAYAGGALTGALGGGTVTISVE